MRIRTKVTKEDICDRLKSRSLGQVIETKQNRMLVKTLTILICSCFIHCTNNNAGGIRALEIYPNSLLVQSVVDTLPKRAPKSLSTMPCVFNESSVIKILSLDKTLDSNSRFLKMYKQKCDDWKLADKDIVHIIQSSTTIDGPEFHHFYEVLPCNYSGDLMIDCRAGSFQINGGSFSILVFDDTTVYLGYKNPDYQKYFLVPPGTE